LGFWRENFWRWVCTVGSALGGFVCFSVPLAKGEQPLPEGILATPEREAPSPRVAGELFLAGLLVQSR
jgi:hypothetical protein